MKKVFDGFLRWWPVLAAMVAAIVFVISLSGRVNTMETSITLLREQVSKTCDKMEAMATDVTRIREDMAFIRGSQQKPPTVAVAGSPNQ